MIIPNKHSGYQAGIRRYYMGGGGSLGSTGSIFSSASNAAPNADPYTSANRPNYVPVGANGQFNQPIFQPKYENYSMNNPMSVSEYGTSGGNYFLQNPDVQQAFTQSPHPGSANQFAQMHYDKFGRTEGRTAPGMYPQMQNTPFNPYTNGSSGGFGGGGGFGSGGGFMPQQQMYQPQQQMQPSFNYQQPSYGRSNFIYDAPLPEGMLGTMGGTGYNPATGRSDLGTAGGSGQFTPQTMQPLPIQPAPTNYGPSRAIVGRSAQMRGTPNVMRRAEGGIASLTSSIE